MRIIVLWEPDDECRDPLDKHGTPRRHYDEITGDAILMWLTDHGDPDGPEDDDNHQDIHVAGMGRFENVTIDLANEAMGVLTDLE